MENSIEEQPEWILMKKAEKMKLDIEDETFALAMDKEDPLARFRSQFNFPKMKHITTVETQFTNSEEEEEDCIYLCGNSLGLQPKMVKNHMDKTLDDWAKWGVLSHFSGNLSAAYCDEPGREATAKLIGAKTKEVALMNGLSVNIHLLFISFYRPTPTRHKILMESHEFPSDIYALRSQIEMHGYDPEESMMFMKPREGECIHAMEDIINLIEEHGDTIAVIWLSGVNHFTGQKFDMKKITEAGQKKGCIVGFDLAHSICNVKLEMHDWSVDFAAWCSYKYMNSGAGGVGGIFVHEKHNERKAPQLLGWWSNKSETRFEMRHVVDKAIGAESFRISNPPPFLMCLNLASLNIFKQTSMDELVAKQYLLTGYLEAAIKNLQKRNSKCEVRILTPADPKQRGNQLSLSFSVSAKDIHKQLEMNGVVCDVRPPNVIRIAPAPLYNSYHDVYRFVQILQKALNSKTSSEHFN